MNRCCLGCALAMTVWFGEAVANAQQAGRVSLWWAAPDECADDVQVVHQVEALLGQSLLAAGEQSLTVRATVRGDGARGYAATISFKSLQGTEERALEHPSCEKLVEAVALVVALAIDPDRVQATRRVRESEAAAPVVRPVPRREGAEPVVVTTPRAALPRDSEPRDVPPTRNWLRGVRMALHGVVGAGPLPKFGGGVEAVLGFRREWFRADLVGRYWLPRASVVNVAPSASVDVALSTLGLRACWVPIHAAWSVAACAGGDIGDQSGAGLGVDAPRTQHALYADVAGGLQLAYTRARLAPEGGFEVTGATARPRFGVVQDGLRVETFRSAAWGFSAFLGLAFEL